MNDEINYKLKLPKYLKAFYGWVYESRDWSDFFDNSIVQTIKSWGYNYRLRNSVLREITPKTKVLQMGVTFGPLIEEIADKIGANGEYDIMDVSKLQLQRVRSKFQYVYPQMRLLNKDVSKKFDEKDYDVVICYMILHEVPPRTKVKIIENALNSIKENGKVVFVDYHNPLKYHPLRYFVRMYNRLRQPFAEKLWDLDIADYCKERLKYSWRKTTFFGRMYQKTVVRKKKIEI